MATRKLILGVCVFLMSSPFFTQAEALTCTAVAPKGTVALTFDDGPSPQDTAKILSILEQNHIHATFFVVGEMAKLRPQYLKQEQADGDVIGNHTYTHPVSNKISLDKLHTEIQSTQDVVYNITGQKPQVFRFPYGAANAQDISYVKSLGLTPVGWSNCPEDYRRPGANVIAQRVISHLGSGQVILLHDGPSRREQTVEALPLIIDAVKKKGLGFSVLCS